jgi:hypothetical protein
MLAQHPELLRREFALPFGVGLADFVFGVGHAFILLGLWESWWARHGKARLFFFEKKNQKTFGPWRRAGRTSAGPNEQKFFASFFQKRSPFFHSLR